MHDSDRGVHLSQHGSRLDAFVADLNVRSGQNRRWRGCPATVQIGLFRPLLSPIPGVEKPDFSRHLDFHTTAGWLYHLLGHVKQQLAVRFFDSTQ